MHVEDYPEEERPIEVHVDESQRAFLEYFEGLALQDLEQTKSASRVIAKLNSPYANSTAKAADQFEAKLLDSANDLSEIMRKGVATGLLAHTYSGLRLEWSYLEITVASIGKDKKWVRNQIRQSSYQIEERIAPTTIITADVLHQRNRSALHDLGLDSYFSKLFWPLRNLFTRQAAV